jgi:hypothetical protein
VFKSSIAKILIIVLFLKIISIMDFDDFFIISQFFLILFSTFPPKIPRHTSVLRAHQLKIAAPEVSYLFLWMREPQIS